MVTKGLLVRLEAKPGKEDEVEKFLTGALPVIDGEPATTAWFALRLGASTFAIYDCFPDDAGRQAHLSGPIARALGEQGAELFSQDPVIEMAEVLAAKLPGS
ncbi:MAG: putative quinol monooxygenase [Candidatus Dormibacteria bacterium]